jgi:hypothetical protein
MFRSNYLPLFTRLKTSTRVKRLTLYKAALGSSETMVITIQPNIADDLKVLISITAYGTPIKLRQGLQSVDQLR